MKFQEDACKVNNCHLTTNHSAFATADAVLVHGFYYARNNPQPLPKRARDDQIYAFLNTESPARTPYFSWLNDTFNFTIGYLPHPDTDLWHPYGHVFKRAPSDEYKKYPKLKKRFRNKYKMVAWVVSNCAGSSARMAYVDELQKYIDVDIFGQCGNRSCSRESCFADIAKRYKFYLAFENSYCRNYITEKFFRTLQYDMIPIVLGAGDYKAVAPPHSYIDVSDFANPQILAEHLKKLGTRPHEYLKYFEWKRTYYSVQYARSTWSTCHFCDILHDPGYQYKTRFDLWRYFYQSSPCVEIGDQLHLLGLPSRRENPVIA